MIRVVKNGFCVYLYLVNNKKGTATLSRTTLG